MALKRYIGSYKNNFIFYNFKSQSKTQKTRVIVNGSMDFTLDTDLHTQLWLTLTYR